MSVQKYIYHAKQLVPLFYVLQNLIRELPRLNALGLTGCSLEMAAMVAALMNEKREGISVDVWQKWSVLLREAKEHGDEYTSCVRDGLWLDCMDDDPSYSVWEDITLLEGIHHGRIKTDFYL